MGVVQQQTIRPINLGQKYRTFICADIADICEQNPILIHDARIRACASSEPRSRQTVWRVGLCWLFEVELRTLAVRVASVSKGRDWAASMPVLEAQAVAGREALKTKLVGPYKSTMTLNDGSYWFLVRLVPIRFWIRQLTTTSTGLLRVSRT
jgi:hypothetical protein